MNMKTMIRSSVFAAAILTLALLSGCAKGGNGPCQTNCPEIDVAGVSNGIPVNGGPTGLNLPITFTATFKNTTQAPVNWTITGSSCSGSGNPCGSFTSTTDSTANYVGPSSVPANQSVTITATSKSDSSLSGAVNLTITPITTQVSPATLSVSIGETQKFTAVALPDNSPQTFTWTCTANGAGCANFVQDPNVSGLASYTPAAGEACGANCVSISAFPTSDPTGSGCSYNPKKYPCVIGNPTVVTSRVTWTYVFRFSGFDNSGSPVFAAGTFVADSNGSITSGFEDEITSGGTTQHSITGGSYTPTSSDPGDSNNAGTLKLTTGAFPNQFQVVLNAAGEIQMIESDGHGSGSGNAELTSTNQFNKGTAQTFAFGLTGVDSAGHRVGYVGLLQTDGNGSVPGGLIDVNDNGDSTNAVCGAPPCPLAGSYVSNGNGSYRLTLTSPALKFDLFVANGQAKSGTNLLNLYAISVDPVDASHPAVLGALQFQDPAPTGSSATYDNAAFSGSSVSALIGTNGDVALVQGSTNGSGGFSGTFDHNNLGTIVSVPPVPAASCPPQDAPKTVCAFAYTYGATDSNKGRYTFQMLGDPNGKKGVVQPIPFVLYASGANNGFLLDQASGSVMTGVMISPQLPKSAVGSFAPTAMTGTYAVATNSNSIPSGSCAPLLACESTMNLVLTSPGNLVYNVVGTENSGGQAITGKYDVQSSGVGALTLTSPAANYVIYGVTETDFFMIDLDPVPSPILYMSQ